MNRDRYEKVKRLAEQSPFPGERAAAMAALMRIEEADPNRSKVAASLGEKFEKAQVLANAAARAALERMRQETAHGDCGAVPVVFAGHDF